MGDRIMQVDAQRVDDSRVLEKQFRKMLMKIAMKLKRDDEVEKVKFMCSFIPRSRREEIKSMLQLLEEIEFNDHLSFDDTEFLKECMEEIHRLDLVRLIEEYEATRATPMPAGTGRQNRTDAQPSVRPSKGPVTQESSPGTDLSDEFEFLRDNLGREWRSLARKFCLSETDIDAISYNYSRDLKEQSMQAMNLWKKNLGQRADKKTLIEHLRKCKLNYLADAVTNLKPRDSN